MVSSHQEGRPVLDHGVYSQEVVFSYVEDLEGEVDDRTFAGEHHRVEEEHHMVVARRTVEEHTLAGRRRAKDEHRKVKGNTWAEVVVRSKRVEVLRSIQAEVHKLEEAARLAAVEPVIFGLTSIRSPFLA